MNTLNEIRFDDKDLFFNDNIVKTSILPQGTKDLKRNIKVQANSVFEGSVFGNNVEIEQTGIGNGECITFGSEPMYPVR